MRGFLFIVLSVVFFKLNIIAQPIVVNSSNKVYKNFYDLQKDFYNDPQIRKIEKEQKEKIKNANYKNKGEEENEEEMGKWFQFKRWEYFIESRVYPTGDFFSPSVSYDNFQQYLNSGKYYKQEQQRSSLFSGNWKSLNPQFIDGDNGIGAGRINCVRFHPKDVNTIFVGTPNGGLWKSTDGGISWTTNTDFLANISVSDLAIDPINPNIMYLATGDADGGASGGWAIGYSLGIYKSTDGGNTWFATNLSWKYSQTLLISKILINTTNTNVLLAATSNGIWKSTDGGINWGANPVIVGNFRDIEFKPGDPSVVYATSTSFYKSTNAGDSFTLINTGLPNEASISRYSIAVTPADPSIVYLIAGDATTQGFFGFYRSQDEGATFTKRSSTPNILSGVFDGSGTSGQSHFTLAINASPSNKNIVIVGGVNLWSSNDGGATWKLVSDWSTFLPNGGGGSAPYVHADIHDIQYLPNDTNVVFAGSDGGLFKTNALGTKWSFLSKNMEIGQIYRIGNSVSEKDMIVQGLQDNQTMLNKPNQNTYKVLFWGDGMDCFIDWSDNNYIYGEQYNGTLQRSSDGGITSIPIYPNGINEKGDWVTPWLMNPLNSKTLYAGYSNLWKSLDRGNSWNKISTPHVINGVGSGLIKAIAIAPSDTNTIYVLKNNGLYKTTTGGIPNNTWNNIARGKLPVNINALSNITVSDIDPNKIWVTFSGYTDTIKVYQSIDGGNSWKNIGNKNSGLSNGLPNLPINTIVYQNGTNDVVYVGTDVGVYYTSDGGVNWNPFFTGLPNTIVSELEIHYGSQKLRAATFGRGIWESDLYNTVAPEPEEDSVLVIEPNPSRGEFNVKFSLVKKSNYVLEINNSLGQLIYREKLNDFSGNYFKSFDMTDDAKGIYLVTVYDDEKRFVGKTILY